MFIIKVLSRYTFNKCVFFPPRKFSTSAQPSTIQYYPVLTLVLSRNISYQKFPKPKSNFWIRKYFSTARSNTSKEAILADSIHQKAGEFKLLNSFLSKYKDIAPPFGFNGLGEIVYRRTYSRLKADGEKEQWYCY
jgi:hypothetical protein